MFCAYMRRGGAAQVAVSVGDRGCPAGANRIVGALAGWAAGAARWPSTCVDPSFAGRTAGKRRLLA